MVRHKSTDITVVTPSIAGRAVMLERAKNSVERQTMLPAQHIVYVDEEGAGAAFARNAALAMVDTTYVAFLDDDDEFLPHHLEALYRAIVTEDADLAYPWFSVPNGHDPLQVPVGGMRISPLGVPFGQEQADYILSTGNFIPITVLARTDQVRKAGGFQDFPGRMPNSATCEDWYMWRCMLENGCKFVHVPAVTWLWHHHGGNTSGRPLRGE